NVGDELRPAGAIGRELCPVLLEGGRAAARGELQPGGGEIVGIAADGEEIACLVAVEQPVEDGDAGAGARIESAEPVVGGNKADDVLVGEDEGASPIGLGEQAVEPALEARARDAPPDRIEPGKPVEFAGET